VRGFSVPSEEALRTVSFQPLGLDILGVLVAAFGLLGSYKVLGHQRAAAARPTSPRGGT
jgi:hypothetical protein